MTNNNIYFIANWKMYGNPASLNTINNVIKLTKSKKFSKIKIVYCPPYTLLGNFVKKTKKSKIFVGAQNCHYESEYGAYTGSINAKMIKYLGAKFVIVGHSETRKQGDTNNEINMKIKSALKSNLRIIFCIGESLYEKRKKKTKTVLLRQIKIGLKKIKNLQNLILAYEPLWSIGTGIVPKNIDLEKNINFIRKNLNKLKNGKRIKIIYGGSVNPNNVKNLARIPGISGFIVGGASLNSKKFIDIIKKSII